MVQTACICISYLLPKICENTWSFKHMAAQNQKAGNGAESPFGSCGCEQFGEVDGISSM